MLPNPIPSPRYPTICIDVGAVFGTRATEHALRRASEPCARPVRSGDMRSVRARRPGKGRM
jgi:hypothetical protein